MLIPLPAAGIASIDCDCTLRFGDLVQGPFVCLVLGCQCDALADPECTGDDIDTDECRNHIADAIAGCGGFPIERPDPGGISIGDLRGTCEIFDDEGCFLRVRGSYCTGEELTGPQLRDRCIDEICADAAALIDAELGRQSALYTCNNIEIEFTHDFGRAEECGLECPEIECNQQNVDSCTVVRVADDERCQAGYVGGLNCRKPDEDPPVLEAGGALAEASTRRSQARILAGSTFSARLDDDRRISTPVTGTIDILGEPCDGCPISFRLSARGEDQRIDDVVVTEIYLAAGTGTTPLIALTDSGAGMVPPSLMSGTASLAVDGERGFLTARNAMMMVVQVDRAARRFELTGSVALTGEDGSRSGRLEIVAAIDNQPPTIEDRTEAHQECSGTDGRGLVLSARVKDRDGDFKLAFVDWFEGPAGSLPGHGTFLGRGAVQRVVASPGRHEYSLAVADDHLQRATMATVVDAVDTQPPVLSELTNAGLPCLWAPNHDYVVIRTERDLRAMITDACDPAPELIITAAASDQPDDGIGDGQTTNDVVVFPDRVCLRAERSGPELDGRTYRVSVAARDASGNQSAPQLELVVVPHDQRPATRCARLVDVEVAADGDAVCAPQVEQLPDAPPIAAEPDDSGAARSSPSSCAGGSHLSAALLLVLFRRRRRCGR